MQMQVLDSTRTALHAVAEALLAGPQHRDRGTIRLRATPGGFGQVEGGWRVEGTDLVGQDPVGGDVRVPLTGTIAEVAAAAGIAAGAPSVYGDHADLADDAPLAVDAGAAGVLADWYARGDAALRTFAPGEEPVLWPEHFDLATAVDEVNYGVSPGDAAHAEPYAYVGPWSLRSGPFWNAPFGAQRAAADLPDADALAAFFAEGRAAVAADPAADGSSE